MHPLISVIIPFYNAAIFIEQTLSSVYSQTYKNIQVICINNNSDDDTLEIINRLKLRFNWDILLLHQTKQGAPYARNLGLKYATGEYVQFLDADDFLVKEKLEKQVNRFNASNIDFLTAEHFEIIDGNKRYKRRKFQNSWQGLITGTIGVTSSSLFKKSILTSIGGFNETLASNQEKDLYFRLLKKGYVHDQIKEPLFEKNFSPNSISSKTNPTSHLISKVIFIDEIKNYLKSINDYDRFENIINTQCFLLFECLCKNTALAERKIIYSYYKKYYNFSTWKSNISLIKKLMITFFSPVGYYFIYRFIRMSIESNISKLNMQKPIVKQIQTACFILITALSEFA